MAIGTIPSDDLHQQGIRNSLHIPIDIQGALTILDTYRNNELASLTKYQKDLTTLLTVAQKKVGIDKLEDYLIDRAFEAPVSVLIEDYIYLMNAWYVKSPVGTELANLYKNMRDAAYDVIKYFL